MQQKTLLVGRVGPQFYVRRLLWYRLKKVLLIRNRQTKFHVQKVDTCYTIIQCK